MKRIFNFFFLLQALQEDNLHTLLQALLKTQTIMVDSQRQHQHHAHTCHHWEANRGRTAIKVHCLKNNLNFKKISLKCSDAIWIRFTLKNHTDSKLIKSFFQLFMLLLIRKSYLGLSSSSNLFSESSNNAEGIFPLKCLITLNFDSLFDLYSVVLIKGFEDW